MITEIFSNYLLTRCSFGQFFDVGRDLGLDRSSPERYETTTSGSASRSRASDGSPLILIRDSDDEDVPGEQRSPVLLSPDSEDEVVGATHKRRGSSEVVLPGPSCSRRESTVRGLPSGGDDPLFAAQDDLISLAGRMRSAGCRLPSLTSSTEKEAYAKVAVASSKRWRIALRFLEMARRLRASVLRSGDFWRSLKPPSVVAQRARTAALEVEKDRDIRRASRVARHDVVGRCRVVLESLKEKWVNKKKEASAEIQLQVVVANIDLLNELKDGSLNVDAELARLREMEKDCEGLVALGTISDWSIFGLVLPQVSEDSVDQAGGSSVPDGIDSNMGSRRTNPRESKRIRNRAGGVSAERIRSGDVSEALTEVLREETRLSRASPQEGKGLKGENSAARTKSGSPTGSEGRDRPLKKAKTNGANHRLGVSGDTVVAKPFHWQFSHSKDCPIMEDPDSVAHLGDPPFGLYRVMLGGGVASLKFSSVRTAIVMSMRTFPSVCFSILSGVWFFDPHEIMSTLFFGAGGGELRYSGSVSLLLLFEGPLAFRLDFGVTGSSSSSSVSPLVFLFSL
ncbi:hypothetical protein F2Q68_00020551 [Brassica cretica]|uniref:Uncharacterized protein n=1 Tax=Brassica cretica TaxID=69181 RepID=A0A8S9FWP8_BRACR|nr:hypothetical protein F2Q68_00020551 [Brassica cretica]